MTYTGCFMIYFTIIINMRFSDLSIQEKAAVIKLGIGSGLRSLQQIEDFYNSISDGGDNVSSVLVNRRSSTHDDGNKRNERRMTIRDWLRGNKNDVNNTLNNMMYIDNGGKPYVNGSVASMDRQPWVPSVNIDTGQVNSRPDTYYYDNEGQLHMYPGNHVEPVKRMSQGEISDFFWQMENPNNVGLNQDNGMYYRYRDPNGKDWDVGPGLVIGKAIEDKPYYTKEELDRAAYRYHMDAMDKLAPLYDEKYGYGAFGNIDDRNKLVASDVMYRVGQNGVTPSSWPSMFDAINSGNTAMMLQQSRSKFKDKNNVQNYDNARVKRLGEYLYPGEFEYIFRNSLDPNIRVRKVEQKKNGGYLSSTGPEYPPVIQKVNKSKADFVQRLKDPNRAYIQDWDNPDNIATHKLSWADDGVVYPQVQNINGRLVDFSRPPYDIWAGYDNAVQRGDTVRMTPQEAEWFTTHYKDYYPGFDEYNKGGSIHIKPENRGKFTALKKRTGHSATWFKEHGTPAQRKMATFALNARKWHKHAYGGPFNDNPPIDENGMYYSQYYPEQWDLLPDVRKQQIVDTYNLQHLSNDMNNQNIQQIIDDVKFANSKEGQQIINNNITNRKNEIIHQQQLAQEKQDFLEKHGPLITDAVYNGPISSALKSIGNYSIQHFKNTLKDPYQTFIDDLPELQYYIPGWGQGTLAHDVKEELQNDNPAGALLSAAFLAWPALRKVKNQITLPFRNAKDVLNGNIARALTERYYIINDISSSYNRKADILSRYIVRANTYDPSEYYGRKLLDANNLDIQISRKFEQGRRLPFVDRNGNYNYIINKGQEQMTLPNGEVISNPLYIEYPSGNKEQVNLNYSINRGLFYDPNNTTFRYKGKKYAVPDLFSKFMNPEQEVPTSFIEQYMNKELPKQSDIFSKTFNDYVKGIESRMGDNGILVGSTKLIQQGLVGGVPGDIEVLTTKGRLQDVKDKFDFHYLRDTKNGTGIHGTSPYVHTSTTSKGQNPMDINIIQTDRDGNAIGVETYEIARALFGEDYVNGILMRNANKNAKVSIGNPLSNEQVGIMQPIPRLNGKGFYSDEEIFQLFKDSGKVTEKLLTDTFGSYNVKHSDRALALLTSTDKENIKLVETALDHIGKQLGSGYQSLSLRYPNIDFSNYDENIKFLQNIGLKNNIHEIANNPDAMRNIANKYYIEKTAAVRSVNYDSTKKGTLQQVMSPGISLDNGSSAGGGGNTVLNSLFGGFQRGFTGAMQFHPTYHPENVNTLNDVFNLINRQETIFNTPEASKIVKDIFDRHGIRFEQNMMNKAQFTDQLSVLVQDGSMTLQQAGEITQEISEALDVAGFMGEPYGGYGTYFGSLQTKGMPMTYRNAEYHSSNGGSEMIGGYEFGNTISNESKDSDIDIVRKIKKGDINPYYLRYAPQYTDVQSEQLNHMLYIPDYLLYETPESEQQAKEMRRYFEDKASEYYDRAKNIREKAANQYEFRSKLSEAVLPTTAGIAGIGLIASGTALGVEIMDDNRLENDAYRNNSTPIELLNERIKSFEDRYYGYKNDYDSLSDEEFQKKYGYDKEKFNEFMDFDLSKNIVEFSNDITKWSYKQRKKRQYKEYSKMSNEEWQEKLKKIKKRVEKSEQQFKKRQQRIEERYKNKKALGGPIKPFSYLPIPEVRY